MSQTKDYPIIHTIDGYAMSRDYAELYRLAQEQSVICIANHIGIVESQLPTCRDVAQTVVYGEMTQVSARGVCYLFGFDQEEFIQACERADVEFLPPEQAGSPALRTDTRHLFRETLVR